MGLTRDTLKDHTSEAHRRLDETELVKGLVEGSLSHVEYGALLGVYHDFFSQFEREMVSKHTDLVDEAGAFRFAKTGWLDEDLARLGMKTGEVARSAFPLPETAAGIAGVLYVVEGSTLGGFHLSKSGKGFPADAGRFYGAYGAETIPAWKAFIEWLEGNVSRQDERSEACEAAVRTFDWFEAEFRKVGKAQEC